MTDKTYYTYGNGKPAASEPAPEPEVAYRLEGIANEASGARQAPNGVAAADLSEYTGVSHDEAHVGALSEGTDFDDDGVTHALVMTQGRTARALLLAVSDAGMRAYAPYTKDHDHAAHLRCAYGRVCLGETYSDALFANSHAVLSAAAEVGASVILLDGVSRELAGVDSFLARAQKRQIEVFCTVDPESPALGWMRCATDVPAPAEDRWVTCKHCGLVFDERSVAERYHTCPSCGGYFRMDSNARIAFTLDAGTFEEWDAGLPETDPLAFPGYLDKIDMQRRKTGLDEAVRTGVGEIAGIRTAFGVMESTFFMGSMGAIVGERIARMFDRATEAGLPVVLFTASGGARMQEGLVSLMQMAKVSCAVDRHGAAGLFYASVICDPTTGGVTASFATQGDVVLIEPHALLGFAGQRVIRDTIRQELPAGFQTAEFALEHGLVDAIVAREDLRQTLAHLLALHEASRPTTLAAGESEAILSYAGVNRALEAGKRGYDHVVYAPLPVADDAEEGEGDSGPIGAIARKIVDAVTSNGSAEKRAQRVMLRNELDSEDGASLSAQVEGDDQARTRLKIAAAQMAKEDAAEEVNGAWTSVQMARNTHRPTSKYYIDRIFDGFIELHGDRMFADDGAIVGGVAWLGNQPVTVIGEEKGADLQERIKRNFGCPQPEGYRKSLRLMRQAEKFNRPIVCFVDTQGAYCGADSEERGQGNAIADNLLAMAGLRVPVVSVLCGEGGSGGALALAVSNKVGMQEHAVYSVLSPEGFASILWKDRSRADEAAAVMRMNAHDVYEMGIVDEVIPEGDKPAHENPEEACAAVRDFIVRSLGELAGRSGDELVKLRHERFARF